MTESSVVLRLRVLLCFLTDNSRAKSVTGISKTLGLPKYTITRALTAMEKEGLVDRSDQRSPKLTRQGMLAAKKYETRINITANHLIHEGVSAEAAQRDAVYWAIYSSEESMQAVKAIEERYRIGHNLKEKKRFGGELFCRSLADGTYSLPFVLYSENIESMGNVSALNACFERWCTLFVNGKNVIVKLRALTAPAGSDLYIKDLHYAENGEFIRAERNGNVFSFPVSPFSFINLGTDGSSLLHGSLCLKIQYAGRNMGRREATVIFAMLI